MDIFGDLPQRTNENSVFTTSTFQLPVRARNTVQEEAYCTKTQAQFWVRHSSVSSLRCGTVFIGTFILCFKALHRYDFFCCFRDKISVCSAGCPRTHYANQAAFKIRDLPASVSWVLRLYVCATTVQFSDNFYIYNYDVWHRSCFLAACVLFLEPFIAAFLQNQTFFKVR